MSKQGLRDSVQRMSREYDEIHADCIREREEDRQAIRALNADHVNRPHHLNACPMCIEHAPAIQRATQATGEGT